MGPPQAQPYSNREALLGILTPPVISDQLPPVATLPPDREVGALWRRIVAFVVDGVILALAASVVALPFFETFSRLGPWGPVVGFCMALPYFAILNSSVGHGQTLGKRLMHIQVVDKNGATISFSKSLVRYVIFAVPYYVSEMVFPVTRTPRSISSFISLVTIGVLGPTLYLVFFNSRTRQGLHDLVVGSYVADADKDGPLKAESTTKVHWWVLGLLLTVVFVGTEFLGSKLTGWGEFPQLLEDLRLVEGMTGVQVAGVQDLNWSSSGDSKKKKILVVSVRWIGESADEPVFADQVAKLIIEHDPHVNEHDSLRITMIRGYDLGIAHAQLSRYYEHTPSEWNARFLQTSP